MNLVETLGKWTHLVFTLYLKRIPLGYFEVFWAVLGHFAGIWGYFGIEAFWGIASRWGPRWRPQPMSQYPPPIPISLALHQQGKTSKKE